MPYETTLNEVRDFAEGRRIPKPTLTPKPKPTLASLALSSFEIWKLARSGAIILKPVSGWKTMTKQMARRKLGPMTPEQKKQYHREMSKRWREDHKHSKRMVEGGVS